MEEGLQARLTTVHEETKNYVESQYKTYREEQVRRLDGDLVEIAALPSLDEWLDDFDSDPSLSIKVDRDNYSVSPIVKRRGSRNKRAKASDSEPEVKKSRKEKEDPKEKEKTVKQEPVANVKKELVTESPDNKSKERKKRGPYKKKTPEEKLAIKRGGELIERLLLDSPVPKPGSEEKLPSNNEQHNTLMEDNDSVSNAKQHSTPVGNTTLTRHSTPIQKSAPASNAKQPVTLDQKKSKFSDTSDSEDEFIDCRDTCQPKKVAKNLSVEDLMSVTNRSSPRLARKRASHPIPISKDLKLDVSEKTSTAPKSNVQGNARNEREQCSPIRNKSKKSIFGDLSESSEDEAPNAVTPKKQIVPVAAKDSRVPSEESSSHAKSSKNEPRMPMGRTIHGVAKIGRVFDRNVVSSSNRNHRSRIVKDEPIKLGFGKTLQPKPYNVKEIGNMMRATMKEKDSLLKKTRSLSSSGVGSPKRKNLDANATTASNIGSATAGHASLEVKRQIKVPAKISEDFPIPELKRNENMKDLDAGKNRYSLITSTPMKPENTPEPTTKARSYSNTLSESSDESENENETGHNIMQERLDKDTEMTKSRVRIASPRKKALLADLATSSDSSSLSDEECDTNNMTASGFRTASNYSRIVSRDASSSDSSPEHDNEHSSKTKLGCPTASTSDEFLAPQEVDCSLPTSVTVTRSFSTYAGKKYCDETPVFSEKETTNIAPLSPCKYSVFANSCVDDSVSKTEMPGKVTADPDTNTSLKLSSEKSATNCELENNQKSNVGESEKDVTQTLTSKDTILMNHELNNREMKICRDVGSCGVTRKTIASIFDEDSSSAENTSLASNDISTAKDIKQVSNISSESDDDDDAIGNETSDAIITEVKEITISSQPLAKLTDGIIESDGTVEKPDNSTVKLLSSSSISLERNPNREKCLNTSFTNTFVGRATRSRTRSCNVSSTEFLPSKSPALNDGSTCRSKVRNESNTMKIEPEPAEALNSKEATVNVAKQNETDMSADPCEDNEDSIHIKHGFQELKSVSLSHDDPGDISSLILSSIGVSNEQSSSTNRNVDSELNLSVSSTTDTETNESLGSIPTPTTRRKSRRISGQLTGAPATHTVLNASAKVNNFVNHQDIADNSKSANKKASLSSVTSPVTDTEVDLENTCDKSKETGSSSNTSIRRGRPPKGKYSDSLNNPSAKLLTNTTENKNLNSEKNPTLFNRPPLKCLDTKNVSNDERKPAARSTEVQVPMMDPTCRITRRRRAMTRRTASVDKANEESLSNNVPITASEVKAKESNKNVKGTALLKTARDLKKESTEMVSVKVERAHIEDSAAITDIANNMTVETVKNVSVSEKSISQMPSGKQQNSNQLNPEQCDMSDSKLNACTLDNEKDASFSNIALCETKTSSLIQDTLVQSVKTETSLQILPKQSPVTGASVSPEPSYSESLQAGLSDTTTSKCQHQSDETCARKMQNVDLFGEDLSSSSDEESFTSVEKPDGRATIKETKVNQKYEDHEKKPKGSLLDDILQLNKKPHRNISLADHIKKPKPAAFTEKQLLELQRRKTKTGNTNTPFSSSTLVQRRRSLPSNANASVSITSNRRHQIAKPAYAVMNRKKIDCNYIHSNLNSRDAEQPVVRRTPGKRRLVIESDSDSDNDSQTAMNSEGEAVTLNAKGLESEITEAVEKRARCSRNAIGDASEADKSRSFLNQHSGDASVPQTAGKDDNEMTDSVVTGIVNNSEQETNANLKISNSAMKINSCLNEVISKIRQNNKKRELCDNNDSKKTTILLPNKKSNDRRSFGKLNSPSPSYGLIESQETSIRSSSYHVLKGQENATKSSYDVFKDKVTSVKLEKRKIDTDLNVAKNVSTSLSENDLKYGNVDTLTGSHARVDNSIPENSAIIDTHKLNTKGESTVDTEDENIFIRHLAKDYTADDRDSDDDEASLFISITAGDCENEAALSIGESHQKQQPKSPVQSTSSGIKNDVKPSFYLPTNSDSDSSSSFSFKRKLSSLTEGSSMTTESENECASFKKLKAGNESNNYAFATPDEPTQPVGESLTKGFSFYRDTFAEKSTESNDNTNSVNIESTSTITNASQEDNEKDDGDEDEFVFQVTSTQVVSAAMENHLLELEEEFKTRIALLIDTKIGSKVWQAEIDNIVSSLKVQIEQHKTIAIFTHIRPLARSLLYFIIRSDATQAIQQNARILSPALYKLFMIANVVESNIHSEEHYPLQELILTTCCGIIHGASDDPEERPSPSVLASLCAWFTASCCLAKDGRKPQLERARCFLVDILCKYPGACHAALAASIFLGRFILLRVVKYRKNTALERVIVWISHHGSWIGRPSIRKVLLSNIKERYAVEPPPAEPLLLVQSVVDDLLQGKSAKKQLMDNPQNNKTTVTGLMILCCWMGRTWVCQEFMPFVLQVITAKKNVPSVRLGQFVGEVFGE